MKHLSAPTTKNFFVVGVPPIKVSSFMGGKSFFTRPKNDLGGDAESWKERSTLRELHLRSVHLTFALSGGAGQWVSLRRTKTKSLLDQDKNRRVHWMNLKKMNDTCSALLFYTKILISGGFVVWGSVGVPWLGWGWGADAKLKFIWGLPRI